MHSDSVSDTRRLVQPFSKVFARAATQSILLLSLALPAVAETHAQEATAPRDPGLAIIGVHVIPMDEDRVLVDSIIPAAKDTYYEVFMGYTAIEQMTIQANAERQGAGAWQSMKDTYPDLAEKLDELSSIELRSADYLDEILNTG